MRLVEILNFIETFPYPRTLPPALPSFKRKLTFKVSKGPPFENLLKCQEPLSSFITLTTEISFCFKLAAYKVQRRTQQ